MENNKKKITENLFPWKLSFPWKAMVFHDKPRLSMEKNLHFPCRLTFFHGKRTFPWFSMEYWDGAYTWKAMEKLYFHGKM